MNLVQSIRMADAACVQKISIVAVN
uniref:Uncharacterized protein n=1 Tax=Arundo donax TaxID=35708 RepID=A0A0A9E5G1_ARUDO